MVTILPLFTDTRFSAHVVLALKFVLPYDIEHFGITGKKNGCPVPLFNHRQAYIALTIYTGVAAVVLCGDKA